jgi:hypothetical protein
MVFRVLHHKTERVGQRDHPGTGMEKDLSVQLVRWKISDDRLKPGSDFLPLRNDFWHLYLVWNVAHGGRGFEFKGEF